MIPKETIGIALHLFARAIADYAVDQMLLSIARHDARYWSGIRDLENLMEDRP